MNESDGPTIKQVVRYLLVGGSTALLELVLFRIMLVATSSIPASNISAVLVSTLLNFLFNRNVTFRSTSNYLRSAILYVLLFGFNLAFSTLVISYLSGIGVEPLLVKLMTMICIVVWNFVIYRKVIFV